MRGRRAAPNPASGALPSALPATCCVLAGVAAALAACSPARGSAPGRPAARTAQRYAVFLGDSAVGALAAALAPAGRRDLVSAGAGAQTSAYVLAGHDEETPAEVHDAADDYHVILDGSAVYTVGGRLDGAMAERPGEWKGTRILGGRTVAVRRGDVLFVPRGTPHRRSTAARTLSLLVIKVFPGAPAAP
jgi:mannose-6-phosphate isomerase-like protein (cupin superfamily)